MTLKQRYALSCYEELTRMEETKEIWLVRHRETGMLYVKKHVKLYNREVYQRLSCNPIPNLPQIVLCVEEDATLIVVEEYIHGMSLETKLEQTGVCSEAQVLKIMLDLCDIVSALHQASPPLVHRDIKPSNLMLSNEGVLKLIDFNAAKEIRTQKTEDTRLMGTRKFAAPEQYGFGQSDTRTDIYAMGITMYYLLTMQFPESGGYHGALLPVIEGCIALEKEQRYPDVLALKRALQSLTTEEGKEKTTKKPVLYAYRKQAPVGFRSGTPWKMLVAAIGYFFWIWVCMTLQIKSAKGDLLGGYLLWVNRMGAFFMGTGTIFFLGNYCNIRYRFPFMKKNKYVHMFFSVVYLLLYYIAIALLLVLLE